DGRGHLVRVGRGEDEDDVRGRLLEGLQERVERRLREHVDLVDEVDLVRRAAGRRHVVRVVAELADVVDAAVARGVELDQVERASLGDGPARGALVTRFAGALRRVRRVALAVDRLREQASRGRLARAAWSG